MRRREFIKVIACCGPVWVLRAHAQQNPTPVIGFMGAESGEPHADRLGAFRKGLKETGFVEGQNVAVEYRWAEREYSRYPELAAQLARLLVAVIAATGGEPAPQSAKAATRTIPIVFTANGDPVREELVERQSAGPHHSSGGDGDRRRGNRIGANIRYWDKADIAIVVNHVRFRG
jgi:putative tryptophan/tyrosine transport system substrate-binding protein